MDKNRILEVRFLGISKNLTIIALVSFVVFLVVNAFNTGNDVLYLISYILLMVAVIGGLQALCLFYIGKYYARKVK